MSRMGSLSGLKNGRSMIGKLPRERGDRDVLNKDLWLILDFLQEQLTVDWCWVEGHKDSEGNKKADDLAKMGISMEVTYWQYTACKWYEEQRCDITDMSGAQFVSKGQEQTEKTALKPQYICKSCKSQCSEDDDAIQCQECKFWMHYGCTNLPEYQLYLYECTQRKFTCKFCVDVDDEFSENFQASQNSFNLTEARTPEFNNGGLVDQHQTATLIHTATVNFKCK